MGDAEHLAAFDRVLLPIARLFAPDFVLVSAGFDAAEGDPLGDMRVTPAGYARLTARLQSLAGGRVALALEGGYNLEAIAASAAACLRTLLGEPVEEDEPGEPSPAAARVLDAVLAAHKPFWPGLRGMRERSGAHSSSVHRPSPAGCTLDEPPRPRDAFASPPCSSCRRTRASPTSSCLSPGAATSESPAAAPGPGCTRTAEGIPGDPLNVAFTGSRAEVVAAMTRPAGDAADRITLASGWRDAASILLDRPYPSAPVSTHFLFGRPQDLAFERVDGQSPRRRHHVRLWQTGDSAWIGAATFDRVGRGIALHGRGHAPHRPRRRRERHTLFEDLAPRGPARADRRPTGRRAEPSKAATAAATATGTDGRLWTGVLRALRATAG